MKKAEFESIIAALELRLSNAEKRAEQSPKIVTNVLNLSFELTNVICSECGVPIIMNTNVFNRRLKDGKLFYCSVGHQNYYSKK